MTLTAPSSAPVSLPRTVPATEAPPARRVVEADDVGTAPAPREESADRPRRPVRIGRLIGLWVLVALAALGLVLYALEPLFQQNRQSALMDSYATAIDRAANEMGGLAGVSVPTKAPELGAPVAIVEIAAIEVQQVVVEGVSASQTQAGPGHVPGTAAPGQPGNSAVVARRGMFAGPFGQLDRLEAEDLILVTTTQGQVVYRVRTVDTREIVPSSDPDSGATTTPTTSVPVPGTGGEVASESGTGLTTLDELYAPTDDDRLTLVTSASSWPTNSTMATVVVADLQGVPYAPTPQAGRTGTQTGVAGEGGSWPGVLLAVQAFALSAGAAVLLYRRSSPAIAYLLTTPPLIAFAILAAEQVSRILPAWS